MERGTDCTKCCLASALSVIELLEQERRSSSFTAIRLTLVGAIQKICHSIDVVTPGRDFTELLARLENVEKSTDSSHVRQSVRDLVVVLGRGSEVEA